MTKIVIDGRSYRVFNPDEVRELDSSYILLKPIEPEEEVVTYHLQFGRLDKRHNLNSGWYELNRTEAEAVAKCLEAVMEWIVDGDEPAMLRPPFVDLALKANQLIQKRKGKSE